MQTRCVRPDESTQTITLHYLTTGELNLRFSYRKQEYIIPLVLLLRALGGPASGAAFGDARGVSDREIFALLCGTDGAKDTWLTDRIELLLRSASQRFPTCRTQKQALEYLGSKFHVMLDTPEDYTDEQVGRELVRRVIAVHLDDWAGKFDFLIFMAQKLYGMVQGRIAPDNPDSPAHHELLLGGHLYAMIIKEKLGDYLVGLKAQIRQDLRRTPASVNFNDGKYLARVMGRVNLDVGKKLEYFLATGNVVSGSGLDLSQVRKKDG